MKFIFISNLAYDCPLPSSFLFLPLTVYCHAPSLRSQHLSLPPLPACKKDDICSKTSLDSRETHVDRCSKAFGTAEETRVLDSSQRQKRGMSVNQRHPLEKESDRSGQGWSWIVGENCYTAQWVKQKQEYRSTRPWWSGAGVIRGPGALGAFINVAAKN